MTSVWNDKYLDGHLLGMTKFCYTNISGGFFFFFAQIDFQVFLKHLPGHEESIGILGDQIGTWEGLGKSGQIDR